MSYIHFFTQLSNVLKNILNFFLIIVRFLMWAIAAPVATPLVILSKWLSKKCCKNIDEESDDDIQQTPPIPNPKFSPGQLSLVLLMVMHTPPSFITSTAEIEDQEKEEPVGHRTRHSCAKKLNLSKTSVVYERYFFTLCFFVVHYYLKKSIMNIAGQNKN